MNATERVVRFVAGVGLMSLAVQYVLLMVLMIVAASTDGPVTINMGLFLAPMIIGTVCAGFILIFTLVAMYNDGVLWRGRWR